MKTHPVGPKFKCANLLSVEMFAGVRLSEMFRVSEASVSSKRDKLTIAAQLSLHSRREPVFKRQASQDGA